MICHQDKTPLTVIEAYVYGCCNNHSLKSVNESIVDFSSSCFNENHLNFE